MHEALRTALDGETHWEPLAPSLDHSIGRRAVDHEHIAGRQRPAREDAVDVLPVSQSSHRVRVVVVLIDRVESIPVLVVSLRQTDRSSNPPRSRV